MPTRLEATLREQAQKKFPGDEKRQNAYIFGTLRKRVGSLKRSPNHEFRECKGYPLDGCVSGIDCYWFTCWAELRLSRFRSFRIKEIFSHD